MQNCDNSLAAANTAAAETSAGSQQQIKSLVHIVLDYFVENWADNPILDEIPRQEDRHYLLNNLDTNLPLKTLSQHIQEDFFWRRSYQQRWRTLYHLEYTYQPFPKYQIQPKQLRRQKKKKPWINIYMERHLQDFIENLTTNAYEQESVQASLDICSAYINQLEINYLQPSMDGQHDHIPLDFILNNLPELHTLRLTYSTKTIGTQFYLGCDTLTRKDALLLARGLDRCHELLNFCFHNTELQPYQLSLFAHSLDKGCHNLNSLSLEHCSLGDEGVRQFLNACNKESFATLKYLDLSNNDISAEGAFLLSRVIENLSLETIRLRLNPMGCDGAAAIFNALKYNITCRYVDISACSITEDITKLLLQLVIENDTLWFIEISNNPLGNDLAKELLKIIDINKTLKSIDLRNSDICLELRNNLKDLLKSNTNNSMQIEAEQR